MLYCCTIHLYIINIVSIKIFAQNQPPAAEMKDQLARSIVDTSVHVVRGFSKRDHSLNKPYQNVGSSSATTQSWSIVGSAMVMNQLIRLTPDSQSRNGGIWNNVPVQSKDWELLVNFKVHGSKGEMFGDGMAIWYTQHKGELGPVFGAKDYFRGLGIFLDTYSNHNGQHSHTHPYITAMINNGSLHYDHDRDGTHTQLGGEETGCESKFRNLDHDTNILVRYVADTLSIFVDYSGKGTWTECLIVSGISLPTGYYFGMTAATGELSDNHDILYVQMFEIDHSRPSSSVEYDQIEPGAKYSASPRDHVDTPRQSRLGWFGTILLVIIAAVIIIGVIGFGVTFLHKRQERLYKRFY